MNKIKTLNILLPDQKEVIFAVGKECDTIPDGFGKVTSIEVIDEDDVRINFKDDVYLIYINATFAYSNVII